MSEKKQFRAIKGTRDILPPDSALWSYVEHIARDVFSAYGFSEIRTPIFEQTELFARSIGAETDVVSKEMYTFIDRNESSLTLRPEGTASVARAYIERGMHVWPQPVKLYYMGPMFRRERPQKGRFRQFYQIGAEVLGKADEVDTDSETIEMLLLFLERIGLPRLTLSVNSIGDAACRPAYIALLRETLRQVSAGLSQDSQRRIEANPLRVLDSKLPEDQEIISKLPRISDHLCDACRDQFEKLKDRLSLRGIAYEENWRLVRGLDYYMRTTFEITAEGLGSQNAICGGGRYDGLVEALGGLRTPGFGFAMGTDRLILSLQEQAKTRNEEEVLSNSLVTTQRPDLVVAGLTPQTWDEAIRLTGSLRRRGLSIYLPKSGTKLERAFETAVKMGTRVVIIVGEDELQKKEYTIRILRPLIDDAKRDVKIGTGRALIYGKIVKLRQDLERAVARLVADRSPDKQSLGLATAIRRLEVLGIVSPELAKRLGEVVPTLNQIIHGDDLDETPFEWALASGNLLLNELEELSSLDS